MENDWLNELNNDSIFNQEDTVDAFYCPYTNGALCALLTKGWQPQELCIALECEQMKIIQRRQSARKRHKAA